MSAYAHEFNDENALERYLQPVGFPYGAADETAEPRNPILLS